jgi:hypothetical protein
MIRRVVKSANPLVGPPVHAFRFVWKVIKRAWAAAKPHADLRRLPNPSLVDRLLLARVGKPKAVTAGEQATGAVQLGDTTAAVHPV